MERPFDRDPMAENRRGLYSFRKGPKKSSSQKCYFLISHPCCPHPLRYIVDPVSLGGAVAQIQEAPWAALDTEADSLHHYIEKLCLVQISIPGEDLVIDPLCSLDLKKLTEVLQQKPLVLHGADFDLRILKKYSLFSPLSVFDTMIAAQLLGYDKQGLADLA